MYFAVVAVQKIEWPSHRALHATNHLMMSFSGFPLAARFSIERLISINEDNNENNKIKAIDTKKSRRQSLTIDDLFQHVPSCSKSSGEERQMPGGERGLENCFSSALERVRETSNLFPRVGTLNEHGMDQYGQFQMFP